MFAVSSRPRILAVGSIALAVAIGISSYFLVPGKSAFAVPCVFHAATGLYCPGCGITRSLHALTHGDLGSALQNNLFFFVMVGVVAGLTLTKRSLTQPMVVSLVVFVVGFTVLRNVPFAPFRWLAPIPV